MSEVQENFLSELRELLNNYNVSFHSWDEDGIHLVTPIDIESDDENYICINIDDI